MTYATEMFLPRDTQKLPLARNLGDAMAAVMRHVYPAHTAKHVQADYEVDTSSAKNVVKGVAGSALITRMIHNRQKKHGDAWALWLALGELIIAEELDAYEQREVLRLIERAENARSLKEERRRRREAVAASAADALRAEHRSFAERSRRRPG